MTDEDDATTPGTLSRAEQRDALDTLVSVADRNAASADPKPAGPRGRWIDAPDAASAAASELELAVFHTTESDDSYAFELRGVTGKPIILNVHRRPEPVIYEADATVGRRANADSLRAALLQSFDDYMARYGRKRRFED